MTLDSIRELEKKFAVLSKIILQNYVYRNKSPSDVDEDMKCLPLPLQKKYKYLIEDNRELLYEAISIGEFVVKVSPSINFMNSFEYVEYVIRKYPDTAKSVDLLTDIRKLLRSISLCDFAGTWFALVPKNCVELVLIFDEHWLYKSLEDLRNLHLHSPYRYWYFKQMVITSGYISVVYAVPRSTRLYQIEQNSLLSYDIVGVQVGGENILDLTHVRYKSK